MSKTIVKKFTTTKVDGYAIDGGQPVAVSYNLSGNVSAKSAQTTIRKDDPSFSVANVEYITKVYEMPIEQFIASASIVEE